jgi:alkaline phosphatase
LLVAGVTLAPVAYVISLVSAQVAERPVRHVIVMIADGCGYSQLESGAYYRHGALGRQVYEQFPVRVAMSTFSADGHGYDPRRAWSTFAYVKQDPTDSAAAATAMACGVKTYNAAIGVDVRGQVVPNAWERAEDRGLATGVVTSVPWSHATPAAFVAHCLSRQSYERIAADMLTRSRADVIMGAGHPEFDHDGRPSAPDEDAAYRYVGGPGLWRRAQGGALGRDADGDGMADPWTLVQTKEEFLRLGTGPTPKRVLGTAQVRETLQQRREGDGQAEPFAVPPIVTVPTLADMARGALNVLDDDPDGFALMVEGGAVDWAGHANQSGRLIEEEIDFSRAVEAVVEWVEARSSWDETLLIVTGDHETGYLTGPGADPKFVPVRNNGQGKLPGMAWNYTSHTNQLIPLFAKGAGAERLAARATRTDPLRGRYLDNTDLAAVVFELLR